MPLSFPLSDFELKQIKIIDGYMNTNSKMIQLSDDDKSCCKDIIETLIQREIIVDAEIDNANAYMIIGNYNAFKEWIESENKKRAPVMTNQRATMPSFEFLSNNCEKLLREILDNRNPDGSCDLSHWEERFDALNISEDIELRSQFGKLKERGMIFVKWADNIPYLLSVLEDGLSYFELKDLYSPNTEKLEGKLRKKYDVFISHASNDKLDYVSGLVNEIKKLGIEVFYDSDVLSWGDNWKEKILEGTSNSEFAVIVISNSFFGREWTEKELNEFLKRQNESGQKIVLPLLYNISISEMTSKYPHLSEIQAIESTKLTNQDITILLAKEIIKRLKE